MVKANSISFESHITPINIKKLNNNIFEDIDGGALGYANDLCIHYLIVDSQELSILKKYAKDHSLKMPKALSSGTDGTTFLQSDLRKLLGIAEPNLGDLLLGKNIGPTLQDALGAIGIKFETEYYNPSIIF